MITQDEKDILSFLRLMNKEKLTAPEITNRKESVKERQQRIYNDHNKYKALRAAKKNLK